MRGNHRKQGFRHPGGRLKSAGAKGWVVYVIGPDHGGAPCKVGYTCRLGARLSGIQTGHWETFIVHDFFVAGSKQDACAVEKAMHDRLKGSRMRGEWFDVSPAEACWHLLDVVADTNGG